MSISAQPATDWFPAFGVYRDEWGRLTGIDRDGQRHVDATVRRLFPFTVPDKWLSVCDAGGKELVCVEHPEHLTPAVRTVLVDAALQREFVPVIRKILHVSGAVEPCEWLVETDRGTTVLVLNSEEDVRRVDVRQAMITDASGQRFLVADVPSMDPKSRQHLERYV